MFLTLVCQYCKTAYFHAWRMNEELTFVQVVQNCVSKQEQLIARTLMLLGVIK